MTDPTLPGRVIAAIMLLTMVACGPQMTHHLATDMRTSSRTVVEIESESHSVMDTVTCVEDVMRSVSRDSPVSVSGSTVVAAAGGTNYVVAMADVSPARDGTIITFYSDSYWGDEIALPALMRCARKTH